MALLLIFVCEIADSSSFFVRAYAHVSVPVCDTNSGTEPTDETSVPEAVPVSTSYSCHAAEVLDLEIRGLFVDSTEFGQWDPTEPDPTHLEDEGEPPIA